MKQYVHLRARLGWVRRPIHLALATLAFAAGALAETINPALFAYRSTIFVTDYSGASELANFPVLVKLSENAPAGLSYDECTPETLRFADDDGTYTLAIRATTTYNDIVWVRETAATSQTVADQSTYTWKGGDGLWTDPGMWLNDAIGAGTLPGTSSNIRIEPSIASTVTLPSSQTFEKFYLSTENSPVTIKGSVAAANIYMRAAQTAHPLRLENSIFGTKNAGSSLKQVETVDNLPSLEVVNGSAIYLASAIGECDYTAFGWVWLGSTVKQTAGCFEHAGEDGKGIPGFTVRYNVAEADGTYSCVVEKRKSGCCIILY
ncbi:MAG: hypothetical protein SPK06_07655 [Kiritimatiellia bacterium]|nr:hypothetical protein [Kiritimatiellia bacterium]